MADDENRNKLFDEIRLFSQRKLKKVETKLTTPSGELLTEKRNPKGLISKPSNGNKGPGYVVDTKPDLQVGMILPGLFIASQDVAQDKPLLEQYEITHILNLAYGVENAFEDDYNYKKLEILDVPETVITDYVDECYDFIEEGIQRGNCLVHCNAGVSRSTAICCAYLMKKQKIKYKEALALVREARAFARPNDGFAKQLEQYDDQLFGQHAAPDSAEDAFVARKRAEIEAEKAAILGASAVKNRLKTFGPQLESVYAQKLSTINAPLFKLPLKKKSTATSATTTTTTPKAQSKFQPVPGAPLPPPPPPPPPPSSLLLLSPTKKQTSNKFVQKSSVVTPTPTPTPPPPPPVSKKLGGPKKVVPKKLVISPVRQHSINDPNQSPTVDETPITVSGQRKLWEASKKKEAEEDLNVVPNNVRSIPKLKTTPATPAISNNSNNNKAKLSWTPTVSETSGNVAPVEPTRGKPKKIIIKKSLPTNKEGTPGSDGSDAGSRRSTRDLVEALEAVASGASTPSSQSQSPYSSPGSQRKPLQQQVYGNRRQTHQFGDNKSQSAAPAAPAAAPQPRKPTWALREQVNSLADNSPTNASSSSSTPIRSRSPIGTNSHSPSPSNNNRTTITNKTSNNNRRESHSPSPSTVTQNESSTSGCTGGAPTTNNTGKVIFGRVPPRKVSLTGSAGAAAGGKISTPIGSQNVTNANDLPAVPAPKVPATNSNGTLKSSINKTFNSNISNNNKKETTPIFKLDPVPKNRFKGLASKSIPEPVPAPEPVAPVVPVVPVAPPPPPPAALTPSTTATVSDSVSDAESDTSVRTGFKKIPLGETREKSVNRSVEARRKSKGLNRSSTAEILKLIKTKSRGDFGKSMETLDEDEDGEIEFLLNELQKEGLDNIAWDEIGLDETEIKDIVEKNRDEEEEEESEAESDDDEKSDDESEEEDSDSDDSDDDDDEMEHTVFNNSATLNLKPNLASSSTAGLATTSTNNNNNNKSAEKTPVKAIAVATLKLETPTTTTKSKSASSEESEEETESEEESEEETETETESD